MRNATMAAGGVAADVLYTLAVFSLMRMCAVVSLCAVAAAAQSASPETRALETRMEGAFAGRRGAAAVLDLRRGKLVGVRDAETLAVRVAAPGSTVKPFVLLRLLESGAAKPEDRYVCRQRLNLGEKKFDCTHPRIPGAMSPADALAWSCNGYFAAAVARLRAAELPEALRRWGFATASGLVGREAVGSVLAPTSAEQAQLQALGDWGVQVTPLALLAAYRRLLERRAEPNVRLVLEALEQSVERGMGRPAHVNGLRIAGKTGTAAQPGSVATHGWFVGYAPADQPEIAVVVYLEQGHGTQAAEIAGRIFRAYFEEAR